MSCGWPWRWQAVICDPRRADTLGLGQDEAAWLLDRAGRIARGRQAALLPSRCARPGVAGFPVGRTLLYRIDRSDGELLHAMHAEQAPHGAPRAVAGLPKCPRPSRSRSSGRSPRSSARPSSATTSRPGTRPRARRHPASAGASGSCRGCGCWWRRATAVSSRGSAMACARAACSRDAPAARPPRRAARRRVRAALLRGGAARGETATRTSTVERHVLQARSR